MHESYFFRLFRHSKKLGFGLALLFSGSILSNLIGIETTPFFVFGMFSAPEKPQQTHAVWQFVADCQTLDYTSANIPLFQRYFATNPLSKYHAAFGKCPTQQFLKSKITDRYNQIAPFIEPITPDSNDFAHFLDWQKAYLASAYGYTIEQLTIQLVQCQYQTDGSIIPIDTLVVYQK
jgi:hypothetical protein